MKKEITILTSWKWDVYEIDSSIEDYFKMQMEAKANGEDWFFSQKYRCKIKFSALEKEQGKTNYIALPEPKKEFKELTPKERMARDKMLSEMLDKTYEARKKTFTEHRKEILRQLAKTEKRFDLQTTESKLLELNALRKLNIINPN